MAETDDITGKKNLQEKAKPADHQTPNADSAGASQDMLPGQPLMFYRPINQLTSANGNLATVQKLTDIKQNIIFEMEENGLAAPSINMLWQYADKMRKYVHGTSDLGNFNGLYNLSYLGLNPKMSEKLFPTIEENAVIADHMSGEGMEAINKTAFTMAQIDQQYPGLINLSTNQINTKLADVVNKNVAYAKLLKHGAVDESQFYSLNEAAGPDVLRRIQDSETAAAITPVLIAVKSPMLGKALDALDQAFNPQKLSQNQIRALHQIGVTPGGALYKTSSIEWFYKILIAAMEAHGYNTAALQQQFLDNILKGSKYKAALQPLINKLPQIEYYSRQYQKTANNPHNRFPYLAAQDPALAMQQKAANRNAGWLNLTNPISRVLVTKAGEILNFESNHPFGGLVALLAVPTAIKHLSKKLQPKIFDVVSESRKFGRAKFNDFRKIFSKVARFSKVAVEDGAVVDAAEAAAPEIIASSASSGPIGWAVLAAISALAAVPVAYIYRKQIIRYARTLQRSKPATDYSIPRGGEYHAVLDPFAYHRTVFEVAPVPEKHEVHNEPMPVFIINAGDMHNATAKDFANQMQVQIGPTGFNPHATLSMPSGNH